MLWSRHLRVEAELHDLQVRFASYMTEGGHGGSSEAASAEPSTESPTRVREEQLARFAAELTALRLGTRLPLRASQVTRLQKTLDIYQHRLVAGQRLSGELASLARSLDEVLDAGQRHLLRGRPQEVQSRAAMTGATARHEEGALVEMIQTLLASADPPR